MSKDSHANSLRLLGSPVNLSYRGKKKEDRKNGRSRPRSALQNSGFTPDNQERYKRPFSADTKERPSTRSFLNTFSVELQQNYNNSPNNIKVVAPTTQLLGDSKTKNPNYNRDLCSNASDYGSEDTFISLGTKIKARAQSPKGKNHKNQVKYRNPIKKGKKTMESNDKNSNLYDMQVKIVGRENSPTRNKNFSNERCNSPYLTARPYPAYFLPLEPNQKTEDSLAGRVSFGGGSVNTEVQNAIETYNHRLSNSKQQLSLVEEESTQDIESIPSHNASSLSSENSLKEDKSTNDKEQDGRKTIADANNKDYPKLTQNFVSDNKSYSSFYDDFPPNKTSYKNKMSSSLNVDTASKDSGYTDSGTNEEGGREFLTPTPASILKNNNLRGKNDAVQSKSLESIPMSSNTDLPKAITFDKIKYQWSEPLNHSRLLYKDFFLQKEGHIALAPQNSPVASTSQIPSASDIVDKPDETENADYPSYLLNSNTKAYTSKVIEDYKKEIAAINNLHDLTIKDLQADAVSPTPLDIDKLFDPSSILNSSIQNVTAKTNTSPATEPSVKDKNDISKVSTQELIQNYLKVKEGDYSKNFKKCDKKNYNASTSGEGTSKSSWSNKSGPKIVPCKTPPVANKNQNPKNIFTLKAPLSARIDSVQNDKDIESWMSLAAPSPRITEIEEVNESIALDKSNQIFASQNERRNEPTETTIASTSTCEIPKTVHDIQKSKELNANSSVFDIYSMLKEIESFGENPYHVQNKTATDITEIKREERPATPKDNFLEIFQFLEKVEQSANDALSVVTNTTPQSIPKLEVLLKLPQTELAQRLVTASLQLEERSCCISLLQESLANHKEQMINKVSNLEKQSQRNVARVKQECEDAIKRHQAFIDQLINDKKTLNHRIEQLVDERRSLEERWRRSAQSLEERYKLELRNQHDKMLASQQVARQRWVRQKAEKIKELTVKGLEGELREMAERQQQEVTDLKLAHAEQISRLEGKHARAMEDLRKILEEEAQTALMKERQMAATRLEKQILELESQYGEQRTRLVSEMRAENERVATELAKKEAELKREIEKWKENQEMMIEEKKRLLDKEIVKERRSIEEKLNQQKIELEKKFEQYKREYEAEQQMVLKKKVTEIAAQHKIERDREIEKAIESLEAEAQAGRKELQDALRRNKEQYEMELKELGETEQATLRRYQEAQARVRQTEDRCAELEVTINHLETRNKVLTEKNIELDRRISEIRTSCEESWKSKIELMNKEIEDLKKTHEEQMHQLYAKVKVAVARKDSAIQALTRESAKYLEKVTLLEQKLSQQRKDFLKQK